MLNKLYSSRALIIKGAVALLLPALPHLITLFGSGEDILVTIVLLMMLSALIYSVPFILAVVAIRREKVSSVKRLIGLDAVTLLCPIVFSLVIIETIDIIANGYNFAAGAFVILFGILYSLLSLVFWGMYAVNSLMNKNK